MLVGLAGYISGSHASVCTASCEPCVEQPAHGAVWPQRAPGRAQVFAPTFPGYGRAEKPALAYSQELWRDFLRDFVVEVPARPAAEAAAACAAARVGLNGVHAPALVVSDI
jgi:hypothetical protein